MGIVLTIEGEKSKCLLEIDILRNRSQIKKGVLRGHFLGFGCPNDA